MIRRGELSDLRILMKFLNETPELQADKEGETYSEDWVKACITDKERDLVLIAEKEEETAGFLIAELWTKKKQSFLSDIYVKEEFRRKGIASKLEKEYEKIIKEMGIKTIITLTLTDNSKMHHFFNKNNYKKGHTFYLYEKELI